MMAGIISKIKNVAASLRPPSVESNPITQYYEVGNACSTAGAGLSWKVHDALRKSDGKECSVFIMEKAQAENIIKPSKNKKDKEFMIDCIRNTIRMLDSLRHPKMLQVIHPLEEGATTIAFASEPILASLHDILAWQESNPIQETDIPPPVSPLAPCYTPPPPVEDDKADEPPKVENYWFIDMEIRYGLMQIIEALHYLHFTARQVHRNLSPHAILVNKRGTWKLFGFEFLEDIVSKDPCEMIHVASYSIKTSKIAQPHLDYMAPEALVLGQCNVLSDMFSLGLVICTVFNHGKPIIQAHNNPMEYVVQIEHLGEQIEKVLERIPKPLREAVVRLLHKQPAPRPTTQLLPLIKYFKCSLDECVSEPAIDALQFLDLVGSKSPENRSNFYVDTLMTNLPHIPEKLRWINVWPTLQSEVRAGDLVAPALKPIVWLVNNATQAEFDELILPTLKQIYCRNLMTNAKTEEAAIAFLECMHNMLARANSREVNDEMVPLIVTALENSSSGVQTAALVALQNCTEFVDNRVLHDFVIARVKTVLERNLLDVKIINLTLCFYEKVVFRMERQHLIEYVIPTLLSIKLRDADTLTRVVKLYHTMVSDKRFGLSSHIMAIRMIPALTPHTLNPTLSMEQYHGLMEILYELLDHIDDNQRSIIAGNAPNAQRLERSTRAFRHRRSTDNIGEPPPFNIPNLRVERDRKTSSAEDMARKASVTGPQIQPTPSQSSVGNGIIKLGQWIFGSNNSTNSNNNDNNFLRVAANVFPKRRLSDNTLLSPRSRVTVGAPSCTSSPGGSPGSAGLPTRRHSSIGPQERRGSHLSPPTAHQNRGRGGGSGSSLSVPASAHPVGGSMPNASTSAPYLGASNASMASGPGSRRPSAGASRRPSACPSTGSHVSHVSHMSRTSVHSHASAGLMQQIQTGVVRVLPNSPPRTLRPHGGATPTASPPHRASPSTQGASTSGASTSGASTSGVTFKKVNSRSSFRHRASSHATTIRNVSSDASIRIQSLVSAGTKTLQDTFRKVPSFKFGGQR